MFNTSSGRFATEEISDQDIEGWSFEATSEQYIANSSIRLLPLTGDQEPLDLAWPLVSWDFQHELQNSSLTSAFEVDNTFDSLAFSAGFLRVGSASGTQHLYLSQDTGGSGDQTLWPDTVSNVAGWTAQFRVRASSLTGDGHIFEFDDGVHSETIRVTDTGLTFENNPELNIAGDFVNKMREVRLGMVGNAFGILLDDGRGAYTENFYSPGSLSPKLRFGGAAPGISYWDYLRFSTNGMVIDRQDITAARYTTTPRSATSPEFNPKRPVLSWVSARVLASGEIGGGTTDIVVEYKSSLTPTWTQWTSFQVTRLGWDEVTIDDIPTVGDGSDSVRLVITQNSTLGTAEPPRIEEISFLASYRPGAIALFPRWGHRDGGYSVALSLTEDSETVNDPTTPDTGFVSVITSRLLGTVSGNSDLDWTSLTSSAYGLVLDGWTPVAVGTPSLTSQNVIVEDGSLNLITYLGQRVTADVSGDGLERSWTGGPIDFFLEIYTGEVSVQFGGDEWVFCDADYRTGRRVSLNVSGPGTLSILANQDDSVFAVGNFRNNTASLTSSLGYTGSFSDSGDGLAVDFFFTPYAYGSQGALVDGTEWQIGLTKGGFPYVEVNDGITPDSLTGGIPLLINERTNIAFSYRKFADYTGLYLMVDGVLCGAKTTSIGALTSTTITATASCPGLLENVRVYDTGIDPRDFCIDNGFTQPIFQVGTAVPPDAANLSIFRFYEKDGTTADDSNLDNHAYVARRGRAGVHRGTRIADEYCLTLWGDGSIYIPHTPDQVISLPHSIYAEGVFYAGQGTLYSKWNAGGTVGLKVDILDTGKVYVEVKDGTNTRTLTSTAILADGSQRTLAVIVSSTGITIYVDEAVITSATSISPLAAATEDARMGSGVFAYLRAMVVRNDTISLATLQGWRDHSLTKWTPADKVTIDGVDLDGTEILHWNSQTKFILMPAGDPGEVTVTATVNGNLVLMPVRPFRYTYGFYREIPEDRVDSICHTKSPFVISNRVPDGSVNLAFIQSPFASVEANVTTIDLSYMEMDNLSTYHGGEFMLTGAETGDYTLDYSGQVDTTEIVLSTESVIRKEWPEPVPLYYQYLIGRGRYYLYQPGATGDEDALIIRNNLQIVDGNGALLPFGDYPWDIKVSRSDVYGDELPDNTFSVLLMTNKRYIPGTPVQVRYHGVDSHNDWASAIGKTEIVNPDKIFTESDSTDPGHYSLSSEIDGTFTVSVSDTSQTPPPEPAPFTPLSLPGLALWLDASDLGTLWQDSARTTAVAADADPVGAWDDKSGNGRNVTQGTAAKRPLYKTAIQNGRSGILYDGVDDFHDVPSITYGVFTKFFVVKMTTAAMVHEHVAGSNKDYLHSNGSAIEVVRSGGMSSYNTSAGSTWMNGTYVVVVRFDGTHAGHTARRNGASVSTTVVAPDDPGTSALAAAGTLGGRAASHFCAGHICEAAIYSTALSAADISRVEAYLNSKWGVY